MKKILPLLFAIVLVVLWLGRIPRSALVVEEKGLPVVYFYGGNAYELIQVTFDPETEIVVAHGLGSWKASSLYSLAKNEGAGESLVAESISHNLQLPAKATGPVSIGGVRLILTKLKYAKKTRVVKLSAITGESAGNLYLEVKAMFLPAGNPSASIVYKAYDPQILEKSQKLIEALGFNVFYIKKDNLDTDLNCRITGPKRLLSAWVRQSFPNCQRVIDSSDNLIFEFGEKYADAF